MNVSMNEWFHMDERHFLWMNFVYELDKINKLLEKIHPWLKNK
jgi:hypothetical protein